MFIDIIFVLVIVYGFYLGFSQKIIRTFTLSLLIIAALLLSLNLAPFTTDFLSNFLNSDSGVLFFVGLLTSFVVAIFLIRLIISWIEGVFKKENVSIATHLSSGLIMGSLLLIVYGSGLLMFEKADAIDAKTKKASLTYKFTRNFPEKAKASFVSVKPVVVDFWDYVSGSVKKNYRESEKKSK
ncbi:MAG TPA: CvpA family protein [Bacteroidetes bacterium]|nr:CvpA family protein [Bacteroidota bacterium]